MMSIRKERIAIFAVMLLTVQARLWCNVSRIMDISLHPFNGVWIAALASEQYREDIFSVELDFVVRTVDKLEYNLKIQKTGDGPCICGHQECRIDNAACRFKSNAAVYLVAFDDNYLVLYTDRGDGRDTLVIYARDLNKARSLKVEGLSTSIRARIVFVCGTSAVPTSFYTHNFHPHWNCHFRESETNFANDFLGV